MQKILKVDRSKDKKLILMVGLPYSGKSTMARELSSLYGTPIVCPDSIRVAIHGKRYVAESEPLVWDVAKYMVKALFFSGHNRVILDATSTTNKRREVWQSPDWSVSEYYMRENKETCIDRAKAAGDLAIIPIIEKMDDEKDFLTYHSKKTGGYK